MADAEVVASATTTESLDLDLDILDDKEFDLPPVENPPTLESILNEPEDDNGLEDEETLPQLLQGEQAETASVSSQEGILEGRTRKKIKKNIRYDEHGSILRHVVLKGISAQMMSATDRVDAGLPTATAVSSLIAVGTSHGLVLVFDPKQVLKWCLGSTAVGAQYGAVSALSFNRDCTRLLCGFAKGQITMWDLTNGKLLRTITDAHPPGTAILHVKFTDDLTVAVTSDSGGSVFELEFKRLIGVRTCESRCLFSGSRGEVCTIEPLHMNHTIQDHPMKDVIILAMGSLSKVLIVTVRPNLKVIAMHPLKGDPATLPLLAWQFVIIQVSERDRVVDPVLAFARDQTIHFLQVVCNSPDNIQVAPLQKTELPYKLLSFAWMNSRTMVVIDTSERAHVIDVRTEEELEVVDLVDVQLVYSTSFYKSLATGGNVSKALAYSGERACYQSIMTYNGQLVLLGTKGVHVMTMRSWKERIELLVKQDKYQEALAMAQSFYEGKARAVVGLLGGITRRKRLVAEKMLELLDQYVQLAMTVLCPSHGRVQELEEYYQSVVPICVDYCLTLERTDILFGQLYERFSEDAMARVTFLECLEPYILGDDLPSITPVVMKDFVDHYQERGRVQNVEACIVHMDIASLDIHQVVLLCWAHGLYDAILYIYNRGMQDYITPLEELLALLNSAVETGKQLTDDQIKLGNKLLVYISCCLAGRAYPLGDIPGPLVETVKNDVFRCMTCLHTKNYLEDEPAYPYLKTLLKFDTREFFNVLALAFEEPEFNTEDGVEQRQRVVDILLQIMVESIGFSPTQIGILFTFLARQMARHENSIMVNRVLFEQVLESLCVVGEGEETRHEERQQALMELLGAGGLEHFNENRLLRLAENAKFYRVCEMLYEKRREYDRILSCYWRDPARKHQSFSYIQNILTSPHFSVEEKLKVQEEAMTHLKDLVLIDNHKAAEMVLRGFTSSLTDVVDLFKNEHKIRYEFLKGIFEYRDSSGSAIYVERHFNVEPAIHEGYIELMCKYDPRSVYAYVKMAEGYRLDETTEICRRNSVSDALAFLLEKAGDIQAAFGILLQALQTKIKEFVEVVEGSLDPDRKREQDCVIEQNLSVARAELDTSLLEVTQLCQRNSTAMKEEEREALWFPLLDTVMAPLKKMKERSGGEHVEGFKEITRLVLNCMMGYIALPAILQKIIQDPAYSTGRFGEVKDLILGMLDTYRYEKTLLHTCNSLVNHDLHQQLAALTVAASRGIVPQSDVCGLCSKTFQQTNDNDPVICFRCGHGYHEPCLRSVASFHTMDEETTWLCYACNKTKRTGHAGRFQRLPSCPGNIIKPTKQGSSSKDVGTLMNAEQIQSMDNLRRIQKTPSRLAILTELARQERAGGPLKYQPGTTSIFQHEQFNLRLAPPLADFAT